MQEKQIEKLKKKIQELQKINLEMIRAGGKLAKENIKLKEQLDKLIKRK
jgi:regulator of replication initiation timing